jgi:hypothetical protein
MKRLTDRELAEAKQNFIKARASLACEGMILTESEEELFRGFDSARLPHEESRRRALAFCRLLAAKSAEQFTDAIGTQRICDAI